MRDCRKIPCRAGLSGQPPRTGEGVLGRALGRFRALVVAWFLCWHFFGAAVHAATPATSLRVTNLRCEYAIDPLGIDLAQPRLFWRVESDERDQRQTAWQVIVASSAEALAADRGDLWDSGRVESDRTTHVRYAGAPLRSSQQVFWKVRAWDRDRLPTAWSEPQTWTMGLLAPGDWGGRWIVAPWTSESLLLRKDFDVRAGLRRALLHVCGLGQYEVAFNGAKAGEDLLSPGWTNYDKTTLYDTRDVTALLREGPNAIGLTLGNGMYHVVRRNRFAKFVGSFGPLRAIAHLRLEYDDGTTQVVGSDDTWRVNPGPITYSSIYGGEDYDARLAPAGWNLPGFDDSAWTRAVYVLRPAQTLRGHSFAAEPLRAIETRPPVAVRALSPGVELYDFGQNASIMPRLRVTGPRGSTVRLTPGEVVDADGIIDRGTMGGAHRGSAWWQYTKATDGVETWFPQFYYVGSRYLSAESMPAAPGGPRPSIISLEAVIVHSAAKPVGHFATSNLLLNRIRNLVRWAQRSNMVSVLTDCPHREKLGWIEQYHLNGPSIRYEFDVARIYTKGMRDMADAQLDNGLVPNIAPEYTQFKGTFRAAAEWGSAFVLVPWQQYQFTGDLDLLQGHYENMKRYFAYLESRAENGIVSEGLGDWYDLDINKRGRAGLTPAPITATAFYYHDARILAEAAALLGRTDEAGDFAARAERIARRYNEVFFKPAEPTYATGSQCALALPLVMELAPESYRNALLNALVRDVGERGYASAGDVGFRYLLRALADGGRSDVVYNLINQDEKPGYGYQLKMGATALTEAWDANRGASHNHFMLGQVIEWFYHDLAGIRPDPDPTGAGFKRIVIQPSPVGDLEWVAASYESIHGPIAVRWDRCEDAFELTVSIPANTTATVIVPAREEAQVTESGKSAENCPGVRVLRRERDRVVFEIDSGSYVFGSVW